MSYKIEKEGYEMYGFKLGQMTNKGRIIGFDENDSTIYECRKVVPVSIIKQQLEQILEHLGVKAEVRI